MAVQITDSGQHIKVVDGTETKYVNKLGLSITSNDNTVFIEEPDGSQIKLLYTEVTTPASASAAILADTIAGYI
jgi:hypothetical protein